MTQVPEAISKPEGMTWKAYALQLEGDIEALMEHSRIDRSFMEQYKRQALALKRRIGTLESERDGLLAGRIDALLSSGRITKEEHDRRIELLNERLAFENKRGPR